MFSILTGNLESCVESHYRFEEGTPVHEEPKFIVFFTFSTFWRYFHSFVLNARKVTKRGTLVSTAMSGDHSQTHWEENNGQSLPHAAGNVLLSFAILLAGASISKALFVCRHMGLSAYSTRTFSVSSHHKPLGNVSSRTH